MIKETHSSSSIIHNSSSDLFALALRHCHARIRDRQGLSRAQAFQEILKLLFCKTHDETHGTGTAFRVDAADSDNKTASARLIERLNTLLGRVKARYPTLFRPADAFQLDPDVLTEIAAQLQNHPLSGSDADVEGKLYDEMVGAYCLGERGEFFTPSNICRMAVAMLNPQPHHLILDPACGTGRFLIAAATALQQNARAHSREPTKTPAATSGESDANPSLIGIDCNPELLRVAKMNQVMHGRQNGVFLAADSLKPPRDLPPAAARLLGNVDVILANPPYGEKMFVTDPSVLEQYDLGHIWRNDKTADTWTQTPSIKRRQAPEILFIERCVQFLKPGTGRAALVLPNGALGSPSLAYAREWILRHTRVLASIHLHPDTFQPVIGIRASLLLLQRKASPTHDRDDDKVFMALAEHIGHDRRGKPVYRRDDTGRELTQDVEERVKTWHEGTVRQQTRTARRKVVDDTTPRIAETFRAWLERQSR